MSENTSMPPGTPGKRIARPMWLMAGGLALTAAGLAAGLAWHPASHPEVLAPGSTEAARASLAANETVVEPPAAAASANSLPPTRQGMPVPKVAAVRASPRPVNGGSGSSSSTPTGQPSYGNAAPAHTPTQAVAVCSVCGVVESVRETQQKGKGTGLGAVAGGVVGGAVGNQMGHGNGRSLMTILGAIGGGVAGNEIEKHARSEKVYEVRVRMDDGSVRTLRQKTAPTLGKRVTVEGNTLRDAHSKGSSGTATDTGGGMMRTSASAGA